MNAALGGYRLTNYHSHTPRCQHADGSEEEYVLRAIESGFDTIGFADHTPWPYSNGYVSKIRMRMEELDGYLATIHRLREKYADQIEVLCGLECEAFPKFYPWLEQLRSRVDYLILGNHFELTDEDGGHYFGRSKLPEQVLRYAELTQAGMETGMFAYLAHPDIFCRAYPVFDDACRQASEQICRTAKRLDMPLEYNLHGVEFHDRDISRGGIGYTNDQFWKIAAKMGCRVILGLDAHETDSFARLHLYRDARNFLESIHVKVLDALEIV